MTPSCKAPLLDDPATQGRACDVCGGRSFSRLHSWDVGDPWNPAAIPIAVWRCACGLVLLHPVPPPSLLPGAGDWWSRAGAGRRRNRWFKVARQRLRKLIVGGARHRLVKSTLRVVAKGARCLDVGCGGGLLLGEASKHYACVGLEPSPVAAAEARRRGFEVVEATLEDAELAEGAFDVVFLDSVIEHVASPSAALTKVARLLAPGGVVVVKTPKFGGPAYRMHGRAWNGFRHGYHLHLFDGAALAACLRKSGFEVLRRPRRDRPFDDVLVLWGRKPA
jgi:SAM-dependent methyltransferase